MSDLNDKLKDILVERSVDFIEDFEHAQDFDSLITQIKQAFKDGGYENLHKPDAYLLSTSQAKTNEGKLTLDYLEQQFDIINTEVAKDWNKRNGYMTGREFYERLAKHLNTYDWSQDEKDSILQAAFEVAEGLD